jgi:potassium efflux system protein
VLGFTVIHAAEPAKTPPQTSETKSAPPEPAAIPASEIIPRGEQTLRSLQEIRFQIVADTEAVMKTVQSEICALAEKSDRRWQGAPAWIGEMHSVQRLNDVLREWSLEQSQLDGWDRMMARRSQVLVAQEQEVAEVIAAWQATRTAATKQAVPKVALEKVAEVLRAANAVRAFIRDDMAKLLSLQNRLANRRELLARIRADIDKAREASNQYLFSLDDPPLWEVLRHPVAQDALLTQVIQSSQRFADDLHDFVQRYGGRLLGHALLFLAMALLFHFLRRGLTPEAVETLGGSPALFILDRRIAAPFLLAMLALPLFYPAAAAAVLRVALVPSVIPILRLLPRLLPRIFRPLVYLLAALYVLDFLRYLLPSSGLLTRLLLLTIAGGGCAGLCLFLRTRGMEMRASTSRERRILIAMRLVAALFAVSVVSNVIGNVTLAELLAAAPVRILYLAALIATGAHILMSLTAVALQASPVRRLLAVRRHSELIASRAGLIIRMAALIFWVVMSLHIVGLLSDLWDLGVAVFSVRWKVGATEISLQAVILFFVVLTSAAIASRMLRFVLSEEILPRIRLPRGGAGVVDVLSRYGILLLGFFIALAAAGVDLSKVTLLVSALGVGIGFGLQTIVNNFVSGLILVFEHPVQVGDSVEVGTTFGEVRKIGFRASVLRTPDGADVIIPNGELIGGKLINWSLSDRFRRINISVGVAYGTDPERVINILLEIARKHPSVLAEPAPLAVFDRFGDSALNFTLLCWSWVDKFFLTRSELTIAINNAFKEAGVQIPFPQQDVHVHWPDTGTSGDHTEPARDRIGRETVEPGTVVSATGAVSTKRK